MASRLWGIKQKKLVIHHSTSMPFLLFYSSKPPSHVRILTSIENGNVKQRGVILPPPAPPLLNGMECLAIGGCSEIILRLRQRFGTHVFSSYRPGGGKMRDPGNEVDKKLIKHIIMNISEALHFVSFLYCRNSWQ